MTRTPLNDSPEESTMATYSVKLTADQIYGFSDLVRRLNRADGPDALRRDFADALNAFADLLPEPSDADGDAYLAAVRSGNLPSWGMDGESITETAA